MRPRHPGAPGRESFPADSRSSRNGKVGGENWASWTTNDKERDVDLPELWWQTSYDPDIRRELEREFSASGLSDGGGAFLNQGTHCSVSARTF